MRRAYGDAALNSSRWQLLVGPSPPPTTESCVRSLRSLSSTLRVSRQRQVSSWTRAAAVGSGAHRAGAFTMMAKCGVVASTASPRTETEKDQATVSDSRSQTISVDGVVCTRWCDPGTKKRDLRGWRR
jgi:hypothetical protein